MSKINFTFNWFYADDRDIAYFNSGDNPVRADGADPDLPNWGTGEYDWKGWETTLQHLRRHALRGAPAGDQPGLHHLLEQQAGAGLRRRRRPVGLRPALPLGLAGRPDRPAPRGLRQDEPRRGDRLDGGGRHHRPARHPGAAAAAPGRRHAQRPAARQRRQHAAGLGRLAARTGSTRDQDGQYDHANAVQIMDAWWPRLLEAEFKPEMGTAFFDAVHAVLGFDNEPNNHGQHLGSAYQDGWWGYVSKDLRRVLGQPVSDPFSRTYCGGGSLTACRDALRQALADALARAGDARSTTRTTARPASSAWTPAPPARATSGASTPCASARSAAVTVRTIHWINRPTFQQAVEVQGHRAARLRPRPRARRRCACRSCPPTRPAPRPNRQHGPPLAFGSCNPPELRSDYLTVGSPDANGRVANSSGYVKLSVFPGNPSTPADEADVNVGFNLTDVRKQSDLSDYTGQLADRARSCASPTGTTTRAAGGGSDPATVERLPAGRPGALRGDARPGGRRKLQPLHHARRDRARRDQGGRPLDLAAGRRAGVRRRRGRRAGRRRRTRCSPGRASSSRSPVTAYEHPSVCG